MKSNKTIPAIILVIVITAGSAAAWAIQSGATHGGTFWHSSPMKKLIVGKIGRFLVLRSELNITDEQRREIGRILKSHKEELVPMAKTVLEKRQALRKAVLAEPVKEEAIRTKAKELTRTMGEASVLAAKLIAEARPVLNSKQIEKIRKFMDANHQATNDWLKEIAVH
jgi:Spy/CpxP family protein refolding chaperone